MISPFGFAMRATHAGQLAELRERAAGTGVGHDGDWVQLVEVSTIAFATSLASVQIDVIRSWRSDSVMTPLVVRVLDAPDPLLVAGEDLLLVGRDYDVVFEIVTPARVP